MNNIAKILFFCILSILNLNVSAAPLSVVNGTLVIGGTYEENPTDTINILTAWATGSTGNIIGTVDGDPVSTSGGQVNLTALGPINEPDFIVVEGWSLDLTSLDSVAKGSILELEGKGILSHIDFTDTAVNWSFSSESVGSFSMQMSPVPVPAAVWLFGSGLVGLIAVARRKAA